MMNKSLSLVEVLIFYLSLLLGKRDRYVFPVTLVIDNVLILSFMPNFLLEIYFFIQHHCLAYFTLSTRRYINIKHKKLTCFRDMSPPGSLFPLKMTNNG